MRLRSCLCACLTAAVLFVPRVAPAQTTPPTAAAAAAAAAGQPDQPRRERRGKWEIEVHGGLSVDPSHTAGTASLPTTGSSVQGLLSFTTFSFGSATTLFNQARPSSAITALDPLLTKSMFSRTSGVALGGRIYRELNPRLAIEFSGDYLRNQAAFSSSALSTLEATRGSLATALQQTLAATGQTASASATTTIADAQLATRIAVTGALVVNLSKSTRTTPYFLAGAGLMFTHDQQLNAHLSTQYQVGSGSFLAGYDRVWVRTQEDFRSITGVVGGGLKQALSRHMGVRVDGRLHLYPSSLKTLVTVTPAMTAGSSGPSLPVFNFANGLQFSGISPLSGPPITSATSFSGSGLQPHVSLTAGFFLRF